MIGYRLNNDYRACKTEWQEVTLGEYMQAMAGSMTAAICVLAGLKLEEFQQADEHSQHLLAELIGGLLQTKPEAVKQEWMPADLGATAIGQLELCRQYLRLNEELPEQAFPFIYAVYRWPYDYNALLAISGAGFPQQLVDQAKALPLPEVLGVVYHVLAEIERIDKRYSPILDKEPEAEQLLAGIEKFEKYGFYPTLLNYCDGDLTKAAELLEIPAYVFYTALCVDSEKSDYEKKYSEIISGK
ncbi:hypothetical protein [Pontibacter sp. H249]|uniref:hypothetical protein n=1 Tax=Pontibacter sp. H249 TaxID=3133420 RepID=UPI0030BBA590